MIAEESEVFGHNIFDGEQDSVITVYFNFKLTDYLLDKPNVIHIQGKKAENPYGHEILSAIDSSLKLNFIVVKNTKNTNLDLLFDHFFTEFWLKAFRLMMSKQIRLESIQIQSTYPELNCFTRKQKSYNYPGLLDESPSLKPFVFNLGNPFMGSSKKVSCLRLPGVSIKFVDILGEEGTHHVAHSLYTVANVLNKPQLINQQDVYLALCFKTSRMPKRPYLPVLGISLSGFLSASNPANRALSLSFKEHKYNQNKKNLARVRGLLRYPLTTISY